MGKLLLVIVIIGVAIYLVVRMVELLASRRRARRGGGGNGGGSLGRLRPSPRPSGPLGPDDDPEFLRDLNRRKRPKDEER